jgi:hypothetical protein
MSTWWQKAVAGLSRQRLYALSVNRLLGGAKVWPARLQEAASHLPPNCPTTQRWLLQQPWGDTVGAAMTHDRYLTAALSGMIISVLLLCMILVRAIAPPERGSPITADIAVADETIVAELRGSLQ